MVGHSSLLSFLLHSCSLLQQYNPLQQGFLSSQMNSPSFKHISSSPLQPTVSGFSLQYYSTPIPATQDKHTAIPALQQALTVVWVFSVV